VSGSPEKRTLRAQAVSRAVYLENAAPKLTAVSPGTGSASYWLRDCVLVESRWCFVGGAPSEEVVERNRALGHAFNKAVKRKMTPLVPGVERGSPNAERTRKGEWRRVNSQRRDPVESVAAKYLLDHRMRQIQSTHLLAVNANSFAGGKELPVPRVGGLPVFQCF
jgi:hypothetical protein